MMLELTLDFFNFSYFRVYYFLLDEESFGTEAMKMAPTPLVQLNMNSNLTT